METPESMEMAPFDPFSAHPGCRMMGTQYVRRAWVSFEGQQSYISLDLFVKILIFKFCDVEVAGRAQNASIALLGSVGLGW